MSSLRSELSLPARILARLDRHTLSTALRETRLLREFAALRRQRVAGIVRYSRKSGPSSGTAGRPPETVACDV